MASSRSTATPPRKLLEKLRAKADRDLERQMKEPLPPKVFQDLALLKAARSRHTSITIQRTACRTRGPN